MAEPKNANKESRFAKWVASVPWRGGQWDLPLWLVAIFVGVFFGANWAFFARLIPLIRSSLAAEAFKDPDSIAQLVAGLLTFWAGIALATMWIWRNAISAKEAETSRLQAKVALDTQISTDLTKAYEQLGSDKMAVRIGAIYTLERVMRDVQDTDFNLYWSIIETLSGFAREQSKAFPTVDDLADLGNDAAEQLIKGSDSNLDICCVLTVIGRRRSVPGDKYIDLSGVFAAGFSSYDKALDFCEVDFRSAVFSGANLIGYNLTASLLMKADMRRAKLIGTNFEKAAIWEANLTGALASKAVLNGANLSSTKLNGADLVGTELIGANLWQAELNAAKLIETKLVGAKLVGASMGGARLYEADLKGADITRARMIRAHLNKVNLTNAILEEADLSRAQLIETRLAGANLSRAVLSQSFFQKLDFGRSKNLTQVQIDAARGARHTKLPPGLFRPAHWQADEEDDSED